MSALAHKIESRGLPTTVVGLVRLHLETVRPPRALWTPFQLGRPFGEPSDADFQRRVVTAALRLLERNDGPTLLEDYGEDAPSMVDRPGWRPALSLPPVSATAGSAPADWSTRLAAELALVRPQWEAAKASTGRTTVGVCGLPPEAWPAFVGECLAGRLPAGPEPWKHPTALALRFVSDDIKALYGEAAQHGVPLPSSRQLDTWFWTQTTAGALLKAVRTMAMASENNALKTVGSRYFVPTPYLGS
ncbi:MAG: hypothetical protein KDJ41_04550 [Hyphomicrobiaceae bacterium]|nr:hypothetical protein [Hyphomicrobiaceae bacterium]